MGARDLGGMDCKEGACLGACSFSSENTNMELLCCVLGAMRPQLCPARGLVSLSFCFHSRCVGVASVRGYQGMRRVDEKDITKRFSSEPFPHTGCLQAPAGRARSSSSNLGSLRVGEICGRYRIASKEALPLHALRSLSEAEVNTPGEAKSWHGEPSQVLPSHCC